MKKFGLVGGVGYLSTIEYYRGINEGYQRRFGPDIKSGVSPPMVIESLNIADAYALVAARDWPAFTDLFVRAVDVLHGAGAEFAAIAANTAHIVLDDIRARSQVPIIGIVDEVCKRARELGYKKLVVFGTGFTMESGMYERKCAMYGLEAVVPDAADRRVIHDVIFPNLEAGIVLDHERDAVLSIARRMLSGHGACALVLGCTELPLIIKDGDVDAPIMDTGEIHIDAILNHISDCP